MRTASVLALLALTASSTFAQTTGPEGPGFLRGLGGVTFVTETSSIFSGGVGLRVHDRIHIVFEAGRIANALNKDLQDELDEVAASFGNVFGGPLTLDARADTFYGLWGMRARLGSGRRLSPFVEGGGGIAHVQGEIDATAGGMDVSDRIGLDIPDPENHPMAVIGGGLAVALHPNAGLDIGYRLTLVWVDDEDFDNPRFNVSAIYAGLRWIF